MTFQSAPIFDFVKFHFWRFLRDLYGNPANITSQTFLATKIKSGIPQRSWSFTPLSLRDPGIPISLNAIWLSFLAKSVSAQGVDDQANVTYSLSVRVHLLYVF